MGKKIEIYKKWKMNKRNFTKVKTESRKTYPLIFSNSCGFVGCCFQDLFNGPLASHLKNHSSETNETCKTLFKKQGRNHKRQPTDKNLSISSWDVVWRTCMERWMIETDVEKEFEKSEQSWGLIGFYGISTIVGYLMPNRLYTDILNI